MSKKLYVGNLPYTAQEATLREMFAQVGTVDSVSIISDNFTGRSKGFGFVEMSSDQEATSAIEKFNGQSLEGRSITVSEARPKTSNENRGGGGYGQGGGFRGDRSRRY
jgi:RNA recognition motif-containing protein